ncbi:hypothetical protein A0H81_09332 [Grifola frondosa]|uniref:Uncharacterized protein n=1 Tax=Grifola frondosa TaxID=5627 RepID=A0A1C7M1R6_GRIFR|nr:hypothetical protein A0H81_09332 [Grifola frondosa]
MTHYFPSLNQPSERSRQCTLQDLQYFWQASYVNLINSGDLFSLRARELLRASPTYTFSDTDALDLQTMNDAIIAERDGLCDVVPLERSSLEIVSRAAQYTSRTKALVIAIHEKFGLFSETFNSMCNEKDAAEWARVHYDGNECALYTNRYSRHYASDGTSSALKSATESDCGSWEAAHRRESSESGFSLDSNMHSSFHNAQHSSAHRTTRSSFLIRLRDVLLDSFGNGRRLSR